MNSEKKTLVSIPLGMHLDFPPSLQPDKTYREAWGVVNSTDRESFFGISNEAANEIHTLIPAGFELRGLAYAEERDQFVLFLYSTDKSMSEIGIIDERTKTYRTVVNDDKLPDGKMCFGDEYINVELKIEQPCNELHAYWSNDHTYRYINLESDCCNHTLASMSLFRCLCGPIIAPTLQEGGGSLVNGAYQFAVQLEDNDGNVTNWFKISQPVYVAEIGFKAGEPTRKSIRLDLSDLDPGYGQVNVAVIKTIGGQTFPPEIVFRRNFGSSKVSIIYSGQKGDSIETAEVLTKNPAYIRGRNLAQKDGRLILYNTLGETNLDYQQYANEIEVGYVVGLVPAEEAHLIKTVRRDENYMLGIRWNYCDGTSSADFIIPGRELTDEDRELVPETDIENCSNCAKPRWSLFNTSDTTWVDLQFDNHFTVSEGYSSIFKTDSKKVQSNPEEYIQETEAIPIPQSFNDILDHDPDDAVANICDCLTDLIEFHGSVHEVGPFANNWYYFDELSAGMSQACCDRIQDGLSQFGAGFANGLNDMFGSLIDFTPADPGDDGTPSGGVDPGLDCTAYECRDYACPNGCECDDSTFHCYGTGGVTEGPTTGVLPDGYVPPSQGSVTPNPPIVNFIHDIELIDTTSTSHVIKDYLDAGKVVYLKAFTTWCGPCYDQHTSGVLDTFYNTYGPGGFDIAQLLAVEFDPSNTDGDLASGPYTQGDYTTAPYPIVNADDELIALLATNYGITYFPQIIAIYPNGDVQTIDESALDHSAQSLAIVAPELGGGSCSTCGNSGGSPSGKCGGSGSCSEALEMDSCYECEEDGYCRYVCYKEPQTGLQAIQNLLFHVIERSRRREFYKYHGFAPAREGAVGGVIGLKYAKVRIYDKNGCDVIDKKYPIVAEGTMGAWQSSEIYPLTKDCHGNFLFGKLAGKPVRLHRIPTSEQEPHFVSYHDGVVHAGDLSGYELQDTLVRPIWLDFKNIKFPENPPKPLCPNNPFSITYVKRDPTNKRIIASGLFMHTFLGNAFGKDYVFPKHGVNSLEYIDRNVYNNTITPPTCAAEDCLTSVDCGAGCECIGAEPAKEIRYCVRSQPECTIQYCDGPDAYCGPDCECVPASSSCYTPSGGCNVNNQCDDNCDCVDGTCIPVYICTPIDCDAIPCNGDEECPEPCPVCEDPGGTLGFCRPISVEKKGKANDFPIYNFHSPDTSFDRPFLGGANRAKFDLTMFNWGWRHGLYAEGEAADSIWKQQIDQRGTRQSINLNHYLNVLGHKYKCMSGITYAEADSVVDAPEGFTFEKLNTDGSTSTVPAPLINLNRESSVFLQFEGTYVNPLQRELRADLSNNDNEYKTDDASFLGDGHCHDCVIPRAGAWYGSLINDRVDQYGSVEGLRFIPFGIEGTMNDALKGRITGTAGDAFIGPWTLVRKSYVSNKVGDDLNEPISSQLKQFFCFGDCSKLPKSCNGSDKKNDINLRPTLNRCPDFNDAFFRTGLQDYYFPRTLKTLIVTWVEADTNTWYREIGEPDNFELAYPYLKNKPLDSSITEAHFDECFLNQFAARHERIPQWKILGKVAVRVLAFVLPTLWFINGGFTVRETYIDLFIFIVRVILFVVVFILLGFVIFTCTNINRLLEIYQCRNDDQGGAEEENVYGFRDNFTQYNYDYSLVNDLDQGFSVTSAYDTRACLGEETNKVVYSDPQVVGSPINAWRNFRINNYLELPMDSGPIQEIFVLGDGLFIQTTDNIWNVYGNQAQLKVDGGRTVYIGQGDFMNRADALYGGVVEGAGGTLDPNASVISRYGHISVDREAHKVNLFDGKAMEALSDNGLKHFLRENLRLVLLDHFPDFKLVDRKTKFGIGFSIGIDNELNRILITKIDYEPLHPGELTLTEDGRAFVNKEGKQIIAGDPSYFCNKSFTASYSFEAKQWASFHYYTPNWYAWNRFTMYTFNDIALWEHNIVGKFQTFYGEFKPMVVEIVARDEAPFKYESTILDTESSRWNDVDYVTGTKATFNKVIAYNRHQSTGELTMAEQEERDIIENSTEDIGTLPLEYNLPRWTFSELSDRVISPNEFIFDKDCEIGPRILNKQNISSDITNNTLVDNYLVYQLEFSTFDDIKLLVRGVKTNVDTEEK